ncbi:hypothetical protein D3C73_1360740 [compost metagenome]
MATEAYSAAVVNTARRIPVTGSTVPMPITVCTQLPCAISQSTHSTSSWQNTCDTRRAVGPKRSTSMVTPMWW